MLKLYKQNKNRVLPQTYINLIIVNCKQRLIRQQWCPYVEQFNVKNKLYKNLHI